jgi:erythrocyte band 7 integral membrane protein
MSYEYNNLNKQHHPDTCYESCLDCTG